MLNRLMLCGLVAIHVIAPFPFARAETADDSSGTASEKAPENASGKAPANAPGSVSDEARRKPPSKQDAPEIDHSPQAWWRVTREELFAGIVLSAEQQAGIEAIVEEAAEDRARARRLREVVSRARSGAQPEREKSARAELQQLRPKLNPKWRIDAMGELLDADQRAIFDSNRRLRSDRLFQKHKRHRRSAGQAAKNGVDSGPKPPEATPELGPAE